MRKKNVAVLLVTSSLDVRELAKELHASYRAAFKALHNTEAYSSDGKWVGSTVNEHDHGWQGCHRKHYFLRRAKHVLKSRQTKAEVPF